MKSSCFLLCALFVLPSLYAQDEAEVQAATEVAQDFIEASWTGDGITAARLLRPKDLKDFYEEVLDFAGEGDEAGEEVRIFLFDGLSMELEDPQSKAEVELAMSRVGISNQQLLGILESEPTSMVDVLTDLSKEQIFALYISDWIRWSPEAMKATAFEFEVISSSVEKTKEGELLHLLFRFQPETQVESASFIDVYTMEKVGKEWRVHSSGWDRNCLKDLRASFEEGF